MPFAFIALALSLVSLATGGAVYASMDVETTLVVVVGAACLLLMLWPGALVRVLYGRRALQPGHVASSDKPPLRADKAEEELLGP
jgi:hypothetical protein